MENHKTETGTDLVLVEKHEEPRATMYKAIRPNASFITQLIATAAGVSQTRMLRRGTRVCVHEDYRGVAARSVEPVKQSGNRVSLVA
jgi:predicted GNAT family acetyltransferase